MIGFIQGQVQHLFAPVVIIMTNAGVGYEVELPLNAFCQLQLQQNIQLWTHLAIREDAHLLYGFLTYQDRELFRLFLKVNGVGAKMALAMMSTLSLTELKHYIATENDSALTCIPGVGKKTAQRLIVELADKLSTLADNSSVESSLLMNSRHSSNEMVIIAEVEAGLMALGYKEKEAQQAIKLAKNQIEGEVTIQSLLKLALKNLAIKS